MNLVKFYRRLADGGVEVVPVRIAQTKEVRHNDAVVRRRHFPTLRQAERVMFRAGFTRDKLKPFDKPAVKPVVSAVGRAVRAIGNALRGAA